MAYAIEESQSYSVLERNQQYPDGVVFYLHEIDTEKVVDGDLAESYIQAQRDVEQRWPYLAGITFNGDLRESYLLNVVNYIKKSLDNGRIAQRTLPLELRLDEEIPAKNIVGRYEYDDRLGFWIPTKDKDNASWYMEVNSDFYEREYNRGEK